MKIRQSKEYTLNIRSLRLANHMTQEKVVAKLQLLGLDISRGTYSQIECGLSNVRVEELLALCEIFHCEPNAFFEGLQLVKK